MMKMRFATLIMICLLVVACNPVGSEGWCEKLSNKPKGNWTLGETGDYTKYCVLGMDHDKWCEKLEKKPKGDWTGNEAADYTTNCVVGRSD